MFGEITPFLKIARFRRVTQVEPGQCRLSVPSFKAMRQDTFLTTAAEKKKNNNNNNNKN